MAGIGPIFPAIAGEMCLILLVSQAYDFNQTLTRFNSFGVRSDVRAASLVKRFARCQASVGIRYTFLTLGSVTIEVRESLSRVFLLEFPVSTKSGDPASISMAAVVMLEKESNTA